MEIPPKSSSSDQKDVTGEITGPGPVHRTLLPQNSERWRCIKGRKLSQSLWVLAYHPSLLKGKATLTGCAEPLTWPHHGTREGSWKGGGGDSCGLSSVCIIKNKSLSLSILDYFLMYTTLPRHSILSVHGAPVPLLPQDTLYKIFQEDAQKLTSVIKNSQDFEAQLLKFYFFFF